MFTIILMSIVVLAFLGLVIWVLVLDDRFRAENFEERRKQLQQLRVYAHQMANQHANRGTYQYMNTVRP